MNTSYRFLLSALVCGFLAAALAACGHSSPVSGGGSPAGELGPCTAGATAVPGMNADLVPSVAQVQALQQEIDSFGSGFRVAANEAEIDYIHHLAARLRAMGASEVVEEPYVFTAWTPSTTRLEVLQGPAPGPVRVAYFVPASGSTGAAGVEGQLVYLSALSAVNFTGVVMQALQQQNPGDLAAAVGTLLQNGLAGGTSLAQAVASADVRDKIVVYDVPRPTLPIGTLYPIASFINNSSGTFGPETPFSRPFVDMLTIYEIDAALAAAGAAGAIAVIDYPPAEADGSYYPFFLPFAAPSVPALYLDRDTGAALKQQLVLAGAAPVVARLTLDATKAQATSYNVSALIPGQCESQILLSSHSDGPNSIEDNGPAAILAIADYFLRAPAEQRRRTLRIVFTGGHFAGAPGIAAYIGRHMADLKASVLVAIEIEHLGAREWLELSPGAMALDGLPEPQFIEALSGTTEAEESKKFLQNFDRSIVVSAPLFGEGPPWFRTAGLPLVQFITGPVYLLNGPLPEVTTQYTDYALMRAQVAGFVQMVLDYGAKP